MLILSSRLNGVTTLTMNNPKRLNGWTLEMMTELKAAMATAAADPETKALILTGTDPYYSAGVNLAGSIQLGHPGKLHAQIVEHNQAIFDTFIIFPKPILAAVNGPAIGAVVTSATLCDGMLASEKATFNTPFAKLGVPPEGCSSIHLERLMGSEAQRLLGPEGWKPTGAEAAACGLVDRVVAHDVLLAEAQALAESWIAEGRERSYRGGSTREELLEVNAKESVQVADAFLDTPFLMGQYRFLKSKGKGGPARMFWLLAKTRPVWARLL